MPYKKTRRSSGPHPAVIIGGAIGVVGAVAGIWWLASRKRESSAVVPAVSDGPGTWLCVGSTVASRCDAILTLIRPDEVRHLVPAQRGPLFVEAVAEYVHANVRFVDDPPLCDLWCSPARTLWRGQGDCDDHAVLSTSLIQAAAIRADVAVGRVWTGSEMAGHAWCEGVDARGWFLVEGTNGAVHRGRRPAGYELGYVLTENFCRRVAAA